MANKLTWRLLRKDEWDRLADFLSEHVTEDQTPPAPETSEAAVLVDEDDNIISVFFGTILLRFGPFAVHKDYRGGQVSYGEGLEAMREIFAANGLEGAPIFAFNSDETREERMNQLGFTLLPWRVYMGIV